jgi:hypothetical protein
LALISVAGLAAVKGGAGDQRLQLGPRLGAAAAQGLALRLQLSASTLSLAFCVASSASLLPMRSTMRSFICAMSASLEAVPAVALAVGDGQATHQGGGDGQADEAAFDPGLHGVGPCGLEEASCSGRRPALSFRCGIAA